MTQRVRRELCWPARLREATRGVSHGIRGFEDDLERATHLVLVISSERSFGVSEDHSQIVVQAVNELARSLRRQGRRGIRLVLHA